jgi:hypothetical protein
MFGYYLNFTIDYVSGRSVLMQSNSKSRYINIKFHVE